MESNEVAKRAEDAYKRPKKFGTYHLVKKNCEHFATFSRYGISWSQQIDNVIATVEEAQDEPALAMETALDVLSAKAGNVG